ncbi:hypothetical protein [uncultured Roseibium sp.]|uniref:hypothetical protein n=1 Tax=uncultured Roseibium sp. TaxID=1936171 RepID=UPI00262D8227|nr:hypothetical protein [uncultured Roseibium sp.]
MTQHANPKAGTPMTAPTQLASGRVVDLANLSPADIHWPDLVESLVKLPRFNGATPHVTYTTAQHCCLMYDLADSRYKAYALLSDFYAAFFGEMNRAVLFLAADMSPDPQEFIEAYRLARDEVTEVIYQAAGLAADENHDAFRDRVTYVRSVDKRLTASEKRDLMAPCQRSDHWKLPDPFPYPVKPWGQDKARDAIEQRLSAIGIKVREE